MPAVRIVGRQMSPRCRRRPLGRFAAGGKCQSTVRGCRWWDQEGDKNRHRHETAVPGRREETEGDKKETKTDTDTKRPSAATVAPGACARAACAVVVMCCVSGVLVAAVLCFVSGVLVVAVACFVSDVLMTAVRCFVSA